MTTGNTKYIEYQADKELERQCGIVPQPQYKCAECGHYVIRGKKNKGQCYECWLLSQPRPRCLA